MKIILFAAVDPIETGESNALWHPLSVLAIGTTLVDAGHTPVIIDCQTDRNWRETVRQEATDAELIGVSSMTGPSINNAIAAIGIARAIQPGIPVAWGGYHATLAYRGILRERLADVAVFGPGDLTIVKLAQAIEAAGGLPDRDVLETLPNVAFLNGRREVRASGTVADGVTTTPYAIVDMNELPAMNYELVDVEAYYNEHRRAISYISSYGCPYACTYCAEPTNSMRKWRPLEPRRVVDEVSSLAWRHRPEFISFLDPNFSSNAKRVVDIVENLEHKPLPADVELLANMRAHDIVRLTRIVDLRRLRDVGFRRIFIGAESGSDRMLTAMKKGCTRQDAIDACRALDEAGIFSLTSWMHDLPGETEEDSQQTLSLSRLLSQLPTNRQMHHFYTPFPSTEMYEAFFGTAYDEDTKQTDWATSDTYAGTGLWSGRREFRLAVLEGLEDIRQDAPFTFERKQLPTL
ncbi:hypothetical protein GCM10009682_24230 [Luedemannella flava]|uniref:B12-binding domain-containing radical SAM protein n=1 Tax=Luedemannella flava TaxID=349316 RepID=A0ABN2LWM0_9ACTN